jgi:hypothetical protein
VSGLSGVPIDALPHLAVIFPRRGEITKSESHLPPRISSIISSTLTPSSLSIRSGKFVCAGNRAARQMLRDGTVAWSALSRDKGCGKEMTHLDPVGVRGAALRAGQASGAAELPRDQSRPFIRQPRDGNRELRHREARTELSPVHQHPHLRGAKIHERTGKGRATDCGGAARTMAKIDTATLSTPEDADWVENADGPVMSVWMPLAKDGGVSLKRRLAVR